MTQPRPSDPRIAEAFLAGATWLARRLDERLSVKPHNGVEGYDNGRIRGGVLLRAVPSVAELRRYVNELACYSPDEDAENYDKLPSQQWHRAKRWREGNKPNMARSDLHSNSYCACCCKPCGTTNPFLPALLARRKLLMRLTGQSYPDHRASSVWPRGK